MLAALEQEAADREMRRRRRGDRGGIDEGGEFLQRIRRVRAVLRGDVLGGVRGRRRNGREPRARSASLGVDPRVALADVADADDADVDGIHENSAAQDTGKGEPDGILSC